MKKPKRVTWREPLLAQLRWFIRLRWLAGLGVVAAALVDWKVTRYWPERELSKVGVGVVILLYNVVLWGVLRRLAASVLSHAALRGVSWIQFLLDVGALTLLTLWTGGSASPLLGFFVLHMVFASLLLPRTMAYGGAVVTMAIFSLGLVIAGRWSARAQEEGALLGWAGALLGTVLVASHITHSLRRQRRRLLRQNRAILSMSRKLRRQRRAMVQHEKMVAMGQMAAGVAHEIANPLASMDSLLQLMLRKPDRMKSESLSTLRDQIDRINRIVRELTTFSRPDDSQWQTVSLNELVEQSLGMLAFDGRMKKTALEKSLAGDAGEVSLLPQAIQQVLVNLLRNALDAMKDVPEPKLRVATARTGEYCTVEVTDNGHGIEAKHLRRVFDPFFTTKPVGHGTGLGLSISYSLVQKHGGIISVRSRPGEGASFIIRLPTSGRSSPIGG